MVVMADREGDLYELHDAVQIGPSNLHSVIRAKHDRKLEEHQKLWAFMKDQPLGLSRQLQDEILFRIRESISSLIQ